MECLRLDPSQKWQPWRQDVKGVLASVQHIPDGFHNWHTSGVIKFTHLMGRSNNANVWNMF